MDRLLSTTANQATGCLVPGVARANRMERGLGLLHSAPVSCFLFFVYYFTLLSLDFLALSPCKDPTTRSPSTPIRQMKHGR